METPSARKIQVTPLYFYDSNECQVFKDTPAAYPRSLYIVCYLSSETSDLSLYMPTYLPFYDTTLNIAT